MTARARSLLAEVGLTQWENNLANNLSGGQQQQVAIACGLAMQRVNETNGTTFLIVTHILDLARRCQRIVEVVGGRIAPHPKTLVASMPKTPYTCHGCAKS